MTDVKALRTPAAANAPFDLIELLFFAYRDFIAEPDDLLARYGFGRAHHRVLHFVNRNPAIRVADLLVILQITKQSLARVLRELIDEGFVEQREGAHDRRERLLHTTVKGESLANELATLQLNRMMRALATAGCPAPDEAAKLFYALIDPQNRPDVAERIGRAINPL